MPDIDTPYGKVDAEALQALRDTFDTTTILRVVDQLDAIRARCCEPAGLRDDLLRLHGMAHTVINGAALAYSTTAPNLVDQAEDIIEELDDWVLLLKRAVQALRPLESLRPGDDG
ncbi:Tn3 family transposase post-transcriptional regulator TnpC [Cupriavidus oxalaticus]|uniref:TnpC protein n=1 Tax=Cupriavidus oxalaticus TaxID=96344 RepID=A0A375G0R7_9BURK|nr:Tn3 family transposase post-transcriptional regulator TnpC [Cupriavidus oxalaticus]QRQ85919.1 transposase [Cupriavidus oxalaticus]QRQ95755.1 transposase [Cupriavidus oxalaticus]WQD84421.1 Tn3 family transposase post-transcriptional regulator TnpC [Cupriavidus oxalaticus]SPC06683.1 TnpC protein [Cupriavidus oxalaticus]SPC12332.1 TnpC protein [Cupriavidus oxalaticus]